MASCLAAEFAVATVLNAVESARPVAASRISWFGWRSCESRSSTRRRRRTQQASESLESRLLLVAPMDELNKVLTNGTTAANTRFDSFFNDSTPQATGGLNSGVGRTATQVNTANLGGRELDDADSIARNKVFGDVEEAIQTRMNLILGQKPAVTAEGSFSIGTQYMMPYGTMFPYQSAYGTTGAFGINLLTGDFWAASNVSIPLAVTPGTQSRTLTLNGTISHTGGSPDTFSVQGNYSQLFTNGDQQSWTLKFQQNASSGLAKQTLEAHASKRVGQVSTYADFVLDDGTLMMSNYGGNGSFADATISFNGNHTQYRDKLTASVDYLFGPVQATARFTHVQDTTPNMTPFDGTVTEGLVTWHGTDSTYFQSGIFNSVVNGTPHSGGLLNLVLKQKKPYLWSPGFVQSSVVTENGTPVSTPSILDLYQPDDRSFFDWGLFHRSAFDTVHGHWNHEAGLGVFISPR